MSTSNIDVDSIYVRNVLEKKEGKKINNGNPVYAKDKRIKYSFCVWFWFVRLLSLSNEPLQYPPG